MTTAFDDDPVLVEVVRGELTESVHHARIAVTDSEGRLIASVGEPFAPIYPRSSFKPLQALGMVRAGLDLDDELLALVCASHSGEPFHIEGARRILAMSGLDDSALQTPPDYPLDDQAKVDWIAAGNGKASVAMNCSGKHSGMLRTATLLDADVASYRDPDHPVQRAILQTIDDLAHQQAGGLTVDGCGAPLWSIELYGLARAFGQIAGSDDPTGPEGRIATAIRDHPEWVSGTRRDEFALHQAVPGLIGKAGAEGVYAVGLADGRGVAIKVADGSARARAGLMAATVEALGFEHPTLSEQQRAPVLGHGEPVGVIRPVGDLRERLKL